MILKIWEEYIQRYDFVWPFTCKTLCLLYNNYLKVTLSMTEQKLCDINHDFIAAGKFLSEFKGDKLMCIEVFCQCQEIVQWIRDTTEGNLCI